MKKKVKPLIRTEQYQIEAQRQKIEDLKKQLMFTYLETCKLEIFDLIKQCQESINGE